MKGERRAHKKKENATVNETEHSQPSRLEPL